MDMNMVHNNGISSFKTNIFFYWETFLVAIFLPKIIQKTNLAAIIDWNKVVSKWIHGKHLHSLLNIRLTRIFSGNQGTPTKNSTSQWTRNLKARKHFTLKKQRKHRLLSEGKQDRIPSKKSSQCTFICKEIMWYNSM